MKNEEKILYDEFITIINERNPTCISALFISALFFCTILETAIDLAKSDTDNTYKKNKDIMLSEMNNTHKKILDFLNFITE